MELEREQFSNRGLLRLILPLMIEQLLAVSVGLFDTLMVSGVGEFAISAISLVDQINVLLIQLFSALATGGAVVASQYIGRRDSSNANETARQLVYLSFALSLLLCVGVLCFNRPLLQLIYGNVEQDVMDNAIVYFYLAALSHPFLGLYNAGAALFRSMNNSRISMYVSLLINLINVAGNALLIYVFDMGVAGAAISTLFSRAVGGVMMIALLHRPGVIRLQNLFRVNLKPILLRSILAIGVPSGLENSMFQMGKLLIARIVSLMGTAAIAANAILGSVNGYMCMIGSAISLGMLTVVGQCVGAGRMDLVKKYTWKLTLASEAFTAFMCVILFFVKRPVLGLFHLSGESMEMAVYICNLFCLAQSLIWSLSFPFPNALRAAGDARFTMIVSIVSMFAFRVALCYLCYYTPAIRGLFRYPLQIVYVSMYIDWIGRVICFLLRWRSGKWMNKKVI